jgi:hypothetical protein
MFRFHVPSVLYAADATLAPSANERTRDRRRMGIAL